MPKGEYEVFEALNPFFEVVMEGLRGVLDGDYYFDTIAEDAFFEFRYRFPGWPLTIRGRANLMASFSGYGKTIKLHSGDALVVHRSQDSRVVILEYEVHGKILSGGAPYDNRLISVITIENRKIVHWRDYMDSLAAWSALNWTTTILVASAIGSGGVSQVAQFQGNVHGVVPVLGYPMYFFAILGFWKVLGAITILVPRFPRLKEWAYAGIFFDLTGAAASCAAVGGYGVYAFHIIAPLFLAGLTVASWALRPQSRTIGVLFPATNGRPV